MAFGLTPDGFVIKRFTDIQKSMSDRARDKLGESINTDPDSVVGEFLDIFSAEFSDQWELGQAVHDAFDPNKAEGKNLDDNVTLVGVSRLGSAKSTADVFVVGDDGITIPTGTVLAVQVTADQFTADSAVTIDFNNLYAAIVIVDTILNDTTYELDIDGSTYSYLSGSNATRNEIVDGLVLDITTNYPGTIEGANFLGGLIIGDPLFTTLFSLDNVGLNMTGSGGTIQEYTAVNDGPTEAAGGTLTEVLTPVTGLNFVVNQDPAVLGRFEETDEDLRTRRDNSLSISGAGTLDAIVAEVANDDGVFNVFGVENTTGFPDTEGRPGKSFEIIVQGGDDNEIGQTIWDTKPAGIETFGNVGPIIATDTNGDTHDVFFSRPAVIDVWVEVDYSLYAEESFPIDGESQIADIVVSTGDSLDIGIDVLPDRFFGPIFSGVSGIGSLEVRVSGDGISYSTNPITVGSQEIADFDLARVTVTQV